MARFSEFAAVIERTLSGLGLSVRTEFSKPETPQSSSIPTEMYQQISNEADLLERLMGDRELARTILTEFVRDMEKQLEFLRASIESGDHPAAKRLSHTMKGAAANVGAPLFRGTAHQMEKAAESGMTELLPALIIELEERLSPLTQVINDIAK